MLKNNRWFVLLGLVLLLFLAIKACSPVPTPLEKNCITFSGVLTSIDLGRKNDLVFIFSGHDTKYYIDHGTDKGLDLNQLQQALIGEEVLIKYPKYWTPLDPLNRLRQISKLEYGDSTIFSEVLLPGPQGRR